MTIALALLAIASLIGWTLHARMLRRLLLAASRQTTRAHRDSWKRHDALLRIAQYNRNARASMDTAIGAGLTFARQVIDRDEAIDALTRRVAELMPCADRIAFVDGELDSKQADAFRAHLGGCPTCRLRLVGDVQLTARLSTLGAQP